MIIAICGSMKVWTHMGAAATQLLTLGHEVRLPTKAPGVDYQAPDGSAARVDAKRQLGLIRGHARFIEEADAILVVNHHCNGVDNYIGANTFLEIGYAHILGKPIYLMYPIPNQPYIAEELAAIDHTVIDGDVLKIGIAPHPVG